ncbi:MAG: 2,3-bisphosphoglycerate-independent phosphoglycerate mutase [Clostridia bacterium]|nr:2,3-bisphosphoglycerate-independent phosphoglycerate mutase [Clostridia bacterium]
MTYDQIIKSHVVNNNSKIVLMILDGLGDLPHPDYGNKTPLEYAKTPNLDRLAKASILGRCCPIFPGITPGSGPAHLAVFGYDPIKNQIGRGILEASGLSMKLKSNEVAARSNFASMNDEGIITDRRAGRIGDDKADALCEVLCSIKEIDGVKIKIKPGKEHRFVTVFSPTDKEIGALITDTDPLHEGHPINKAEGKNPASKYLAEIINKFTHEGIKLLKDEFPANAFLMRGLSSKPRILSIKNKYKLEAAAIAAYPMYRGIASLLGFTVLDPSESIEGLFNIYHDSFNKYDFFFIHIKGTDKAGEDGDFISKTECIEKADKALPILLDEKPDVLCITGDHSTPALMHAHSWHPVPVLVHGRYSGGDDAKRLTERECIKGGLGYMESKYLMGILLANAGRLKKFGA